MENKALVLAIILFLLLSSGYVNATGHNSLHLLIYEVSPYPPSGLEVEYVCIYNPLNHRVNLSSYQLTDFEGTLNLKGNIAPHGRMYVAQNRTAFYLLMEFYPNYTYDSLLSRGRFSLANKGDEVALIHNDKVVDIVIYGKSSYHGVGWNGKPLHISRQHVMRRKSLKDTDSADDWSTYHRIGQSDFKPQGFNVSLQIFVYPDDWEVPLEFVKSAKRTLWIEVYQLNSLALAKTLRSLLQHGVKVRILLEGAPVGGIDTREKYVVHMLWKHGAEIGFMENNESLGLAARYRFIHSKIMIKDQNDTLISTENFVESAFSPCGNRGYGVIVHDSSFATYMLRVIREDWKSHGDIVLYHGEYAHENYEWHRRVELRRKVFAPLNLTAAVIPVIAPDFSYIKLKEFMESQNILFLEAPYMDSFAMQLLGSKVKRGLLGEKPKIKNLREFNADALHVHSLHGKLLIGSNAIFLGSINFARCSIFDNREISLIIESSKITGYLKSVFEYDWNAYEAPYAEISVIKNGTWYLINFTGSRGDIIRYRIYVDGRMVYNGSLPWHEISMEDGTHTLVGEVVDSRGNISRVTVEIGKNGRPIEREFWEYFYLLILLATFCYKVWKDHG